MKLTPKSAMISVTRGPTKSNRSPNRYCFSAVSFSGRSLCLGEYCKIKKWPFWKTNKQRSTRWFASLQMLKFFCSTVFCLSRCSKAKKIAFRSCTQTGRIGSPTWQLASQISTTIISTNCFSPSRIHLTRKPISWKNSLKAGKLIRGMSFTR